LTLAFNRRHELCAALFPQKLSGAARRFYSSVNPQTFWNSDIRFSLGKKDKPLNPKPQT